MLDGRTVTGGGPSPFAAVDAPDRSSSPLVVGISGLRRNAAAAACVGGELTAACEQERVTRVRNVRLEPGTYPTEALDAVLRLTCRRSFGEVERFAIAESGIVLPTAAVVSVDHHEAHAANAFYTSPFDAAAVLVCDGHASSPFTVWTATNGGLRKHSTGAGLQGLATLYAAAAARLGFLPGQEHHVEALARLDTGGEANRFEQLIRYECGALLVDESWTRTLTAWLTEPAKDPIRHRARIASAFQRHLGRLLVDLVEDVHLTTKMPHLCLSGGLFYNTYFNTLVRSSRIFHGVFVPANPGNGGLAAGAALVASSRASERQRAVTSPFLGPAYELEDIKRVVDNCKLSYDCVSDEEVIGVTVDALREGRLVGWFQGRMEWGPRALGNRSILASPLSPYVLDNLNSFLKQRQPYRAYGLSVPEADAPTYFCGPPTSDFMEYEYELLDRSTLRHVLPEGVHALRVQTVSDRFPGSRRFNALHTAFGEATGVPVLVNTSFNGFSEPIVCSPRDAIRVFFGTGLDMLVLDRIIIRK